ncbi:MAG: hypothetical protein PHT69_06525 [Bacteroidales bacterium]|nr:hypothetical protein [Bacteroidales bacterium]
MKINFLLVFCVFIFNIFVNAQQESRDRNSMSSRTTEDSLHISIFKEQLNSFILSLEQKLAGNAQLLDSFYFTIGEADSLSKRLQDIRYPEVDSTFSNTLLEKNNLVRQLLDTNAVLYSKVKLVRTTYRKGYTDDVEAFLLVLSFGDETAWKETRSILLLIWEGKLKILTLKEEI